MFRIRARLQGEANAWHLRVGVARRVVLFCLFFCDQSSCSYGDWHAFRGLLFLPLLQVLLGGFVLWWRVPVLLGVVHQVLGVFLVVGLFVLCWRLEVEGG